MTEPTVEARKAAFAAWAESDYGGYESVQAAVDTIWPIAEATVRAKVAAEIRTLCKCATSDDQDIVRSCEYDRAARIAEGNRDETKASSAGPPGG